MLTRLGKLGINWATSNYPWTNVYGLGRTFLALGTLSTLLFSHTTSIFAPAVGISNPPVCAGPARIGLFCQFPDQLEIARFIAICILLLVATGWRPRITGVLHWWVSFSLFTTGVLVDGGDQVTAVLTLLLLPITLTDNRRWHWQSEWNSVAKERDFYKRLVGLTSLLVIRIQVAGIYFHAAVGKFAVPEWTDGTVLYYWLTEPSFGVPGWAQPLIFPLLTNSLSVTLMTWSVLVLEILLFMGLLADKRYRGILLVLGILFHAVIGVLQGLISFAFAMWGALILYLRPSEAEFNLMRIKLLLVNSKKFLTWSQRQTPGYLGDSTAKTEGT